MPAAGFRKPDPSNRAAADMFLRSHGHRHLSCVNVKQNKPPTFPSTGTGRALTYGHTYFLSLTHTHTQCKLFTWLGGFRFVSDVQVFVIKPNQILNWKLCCIAQSWTPMECTYLPKSFFDFILRASFAFMFILLIADTNPKLQSKPH
jgi:hypothetical protein